MRNQAQMLHKSTWKNSPEQAKSQRQKIDWCLWRCVVVVVNTWWVWSLGKIKIS